MCEMRPGPVELPWSLSSHHGVASPVKAPKAQPMAVVYPLICSTDVDGLSCKISAETDLMREPPDHRSPGEAPEAQDDGGPYPTHRARLMSRQGGVSVFFEQ
jgi:hypothetical protein